MLSKLPIQLLIFSCVLSVCLSQIETTCKEDGTYCQNHWECCSNSCFSYLYKCVKSYQTRPVSSTAIFVGPSIQQSAPITASHSSIESLLGSYFGGTEAPPISPLQEDAYLENRISEDEATTTTETSDNETTVTSTTVEQPDCKAIGQKCYRHSECCTLRCHGFLHQCVT